MRFPARSFDSLLETAVMLRYTQSKCTCSGFPVISVGLNFIHLARLDNFAITSL